MRSSDDSAPSSHAVTRIKHACFVAVRRGTAVAPLMSTHECQTHGTAPHRVFALWRKSNRRHGPRRGALSLPLPDVRLPMDRARCDTRTRSKKSNRVTGECFSYFSPSSRGPALTARGKCPPQWRSRRPLLSRCSIYSSSARAVESHRTKSGARVRGCATSAPQ